MSRPYKEGLDYFPHDVDAGTDEKIQAMTALFGAEGYMFVFKLYERIYRHGNSLQVSDAETLQILASNLGNWSPERFQELLSAALKRGIFDPDEYRKNGILTSNGIKKRFESVNKKRINSRRKVDTEAETPQPNASNLKTTPESKVKKSKVKESKEKESILPSEGKEPQEEKTEGKKPEEPKPPDKQEPIDPYLAMALERLQAPEGAVARDSRFLNTGRRPLKKFPNIWLTGPELAAVFREWEARNIPRDRWGKLFLTLESRFSTVRGDGRSITARDPYSELTGWIVTEELRSEAEEARRDKHQEVRA
jgi:hypothetical protein